MSVQITHLRTEYFTNPLGLGERQPRFSWIMESDQRGQKQSAYRVRVAASAAALAAGAADLWDSGKIASNQSAQVAYQGQPLGSRQRGWWQVTVWDRAGQALEGEPAWFELGLLERSDWQGQWIGSGLVGGSNAYPPAPFLRRSFQVDGAVTQARLYITALGIYEASLNGQAVSADLLAPGWTDYRKRVTYRAYDVTGLLVPGENVLGALLGDGWYAGHVGWRSRQYYGERPLLLAQLEVSLANGQKRVIATDESWKWSPGPILSADLQMGESYDARRELPGWNLAGGGDAGWLPALAFGDPGIAIDANRGPAVRAQEELSPIAPPRRANPTLSAPWIFDLGQNMVGHVRLKVSGPAGATVRIRHAEVLNPDGTLYTANLREARASDYYTLKGQGVEVYEPRFTFHGFRYVELKGFPGTPGVDAVTGVVVHSDIAPAGRFECSDPLLNQLQHNIQWGQKGNFVDLPTDCPQRDERLGWTGDAQVFIRTAIFNRDVASFFTRWQQALADGQTGRGAIHSFVPTLEGASQDGGPAWADAVLICPWTLHLAYGETRLLEEHYASFQRYLDYLTATSPGLIRCHPDTLAETSSVVGADITEKIFGGYGDWLSINADTPRDLIGTAFLAYSARLLSRIAGVLGKTQDAERYAGLYADTRAAFQRRYVTPQGLVAGLTQTGYVLALHFDLLPEALRPVAVEELVRDIRKRGMRLSTGFVGAPYLLHVLSRFGRMDAAYELLFQKQWPSWLYSVTQGATTIWERWDGWTHDKGFQDPGMNSFNHYAYGSVGDWMYQVVCGIEIDPARPGYEHILFQPHPGGGLSAARAETETIRGKVASGWKLENGALSLTLTVPANCSATAFIPAASQTAVRAPEGAAFQRMEGGSAVYELESGTYTFEAKL